MAQKRRRRRRQRKRPTQSGKGVGAVAVGLPKAAWKITKGWKREKECSKESFETHGGN